MKVRSVRGYKSVSKEKYNCGVLKGNHNVKTYPLGPYSLPIINRFLYSLHSSFSTSRNIRLLCRSSLRTHRSYLRHNVFIIPPVVSTPSRTFILINSSLFINPNYDLTPFWTSDNFTEKFFRIHCTFWQPPKTLFFTLFTWTKILS